MRKKQISPYLNKKISLKLKSGLNFSGNIQELHEDYLVLLDKFNQRVSIDISDISVIFELNGGKQ